MNLSQMSLLKLSKESSNNRHTRHTKKLIQKELKVRASCSANYRLQLFVLDVMELIQKQ